MNLPLLGVYSVLFFAAWSAFCFVYRALLRWFPFQKWFWNAVFTFGCAVVVGTGMMAFVIMYSMICLYFFSGSTVFDDNLLQELLSVVYLAWVVGLFAGCVQIWNRVLRVEISRLPPKKHVNAWLICCLIGFMGTSFLMTLSVTPSLIVEAFVVFFLVSPNAVAFARWKNVLNKLHKEQV